jgi:hypothetical protein
MMMKRHQDLILLLNIPIGTRKNFSENYLQFGHAFKRVRHPWIRHTISRVM